MDFLLEPLQLALMQRAFLAMLAAAAVCALLSCWMVLVGWSLMGDAISHAILPGVVFSYILGLPFALGAVFTALVAVALIGKLNNHRKVKEDAAMGIVFTTLFAFGLVLVSITPSHIDLSGIIFGNVLGVGREELAQVLVIALLVAAVLLFKRRDLTLYAFDPAYAQALGLRTGFLSGLLLVCLALTSVVALQVVGVILVVAMLIIPGSFARLLTDSFPRMLGLAVAFALGSSLAGLYLSYYADVSPGGAVVLTQGLLFMLTFAAQKISYKLARKAQPRP